MTCRELTTFIADYLTGELAPQTRETFEHHLSVCRNCVQYLADYKRAIELGQRVFDDAEAPAPNVPDDLVAAILAARKASIKPR